MRKFAFPLFIVVVCGACSGDGGLLEPVDSDEPYNPLPTISGTLVASGLGPNGYATFGLSNDGLTLYGIADDGSRLLNVDIATRVSTLITGIAGSSRVSVPVESADGATLYYVESNTSSSVTSLRKVVKSTHVVTVIAANPVGKPVISHNGQLLAYSTQGDSLNILRTQDGTVTRFGGCYRPAIFSPDDARLLCEKADETFAIVTIATGASTNVTIPGGSTAGRSFGLRGSSIFRWTAAGLDVLYVESSALKRYDIDHGAMTTIVPNALENMSYAQSASGVVAYWSHYCAQLLTANNTLCAQRQGVVEVVGPSGTIRRVVVTATDARPVEGGLLMFSADGRQLFYGNGSAVSVINLDGS